MSSGCFDVSNAGQQWLASQEAAGRLAPQTIRAYRSDLRAWADVDGSSLEALTAHAERWECAVSGRRRRWTVLRLVVAWARDHLVIGDEQAAVLLERTPRPSTKRDRLALSTEPVGMLWDAAKRAGTPLDQALILANLRIGLRPAEVAGLRRADLDVNAGRVWVRSQRARQVRVNSCVVEILLAGMNGPTGGPCFLNSSGRPLKPAWIRNRYRRLIVAADVDPRWDQRSGRMTMAAELLGRGVPEDDVAGVLGITSRVAAEIIPLRRVRWADPTLELPHP